MASCPPSRGSWKPGVSSVGFDWLHEAGRGYIFSASRRQRGSFRRDIATHQSGLDTLRDSTRAGVHTWRRSHYRSRTYSENAAELIASLQRERGLRGLSALESGKRLRTCPQGTFSYAFAGYFSFWPNGDLLDRITLARFPQNRHYFEIHCLASEEVFIVGYSTEEASARVPIKQGQSDVSLVLSPQLWGTMTTLVSLPLSRVQSIDDREIEISQGENQMMLDIVVR